MKGSRILLALLLCLIALPAFAHTDSVAYVDLDLDAPDRRVRVDVDVSVRELALSLPLDANGDDAVTWGELQASRPQIETWIGSALALSDGSDACVLRAERMAVRAYDDGAYLAMGFSSDCASSDAMTFRYALLFDQDPRHRGILTIRRGSNATTAIVRADARTVRIDGETGSGFFAFLREGVHHILIGYDHLAFLLTLLLPAALRRDDGEWRPIARFGEGLPQVLGIVTAFTLAHSITLAAAALGWVSPSSRWVEAAIAISVALAALNNLRPWLTRRLWIAGFGFGLIHGFGFAGALSELGLPSGQTISALFGFNLGVEIGQLAVVSLALPLLFLLRGRSWYVARLMPALSLAVAILAGVWTVQRLAGC